MRIPLKVKVFALVFLLVVSSMTALSLVLMQELEEGLYDDFQERGVIIASYFARNSVQGIIIEDEEGLADSIERLFQIKDIIYARIYDVEQTEIVSKSTVVTADEPLDLSLNIQSPLTAKKVLAGKTFDIPALDIQAFVSDEQGEHIGWVSVGISLESIDLELRKMVMRSISLLAIFSIFGLAISFLIANSFANPVNAIAKAIRDVGEGDLSRTVESNRSDEIGLLGAGFNRMAEKLKLRTDELEEANTVLRKEMESRKQSQKALAYSEDRFKTLVESTSDWSWEVNENGNYIYANLKVEDLLGYEPSEVIGKKPFDFMPEDEAKRVSEEFAQITKTNKPYYMMEISCVHKDGHIVILESSGVPVHDDKGKLKGYRGVDHDITSRVKVEEQRQELQDKLARSERMEALGILAGGVAHDLNNILGPIVGLPELIKMDLDEMSKGNYEVKDNLKQDMDILTLSATRAAAVIMDLVTMSRHGHYEQEPLIMQQIVTKQMASQQFLLLQKSRQNVTTKISLEDEELVINGSESHLTRSIANLVRNAFEAIVDSGNVTVKAERRVVHSPINGHEVVEAGEYCVLTVSDTGSGITKSDINKIFDPFFTRKKESKHSGSGLGLSIVHGVMKEHEGFIDVRSTIGQGTTFELYFPTTKALSKEAAQQPPLLHGKETVLIVDDEPGQRFFANRALTKLGYTTKEVQNGQEAVLMFKKAKGEDSDSPFDLILLDMTLEDDFDGLTTFEEISKFYPDQKVLIASGHSPSGRARTAIDMGAGWLSKPFTLTEISQAVRRRLDNA